MTIWADLLYFSIAVAFLFRASRAKSRAECLAVEVTRTYVAGVAVSAFTPEQTDHSGHGRASPRYPITYIWVSVLSYARCWCHREYLCLARAYRRAEDAGTCIYWFLAEVARGEEGRKASFRLPSTALRIDMHVLGPSSAVVWRTFRERRRESRACARIIAQRRSYGASYRA